MLCRLPERVQQIQHSVDTPGLLSVLQAYYILNLQKHNIFKICQIYDDYAAEMSGISECLLPSQLMGCSSSRAARHLEILHKS